MALDHRRKGGPMFLCSKHQHDSRYSSTASLRKYSEPTPPRISINGSYSRGDVPTPRLNGSYVTGGMSASSGYGGGGSYRSGRHSVAGVGDSMFHRIDHIDQVLAAVKGSQSGRGTPSTILPSKPATPRYRPDKHLSSRVTSYPVKDKEDEEIEDLLRQLEKLSNQGEAAERKVSLHSRTMKSAQVSHLLDLPQRSYSTSTAPSIDFGGHSARCDGQCNHHNPAGHALPCVFRCGSCGELQPIYTPSEPTAIMPFKKLSLPAQLPTQQASGMPGSNPGSQYLQVPGQQFLQVPGQQIPVPGQQYQMPGQNGSQIVIMPYFMNPQSGGQAPPNSQMEDILKQLAESIPNLSKGNLKKRSVGTQSVEDLTSHRSDNLDDSDEEMMQLQRGNGGLHNAMPGLNFDSENESMIDQHEDMRRSAGELRQLELAAFAAAKWWGFTKRKQNEREQRALDNDFDEFCRAEFPYREKLNSAANELQFIDNHLNAAPSKLSPKPSPAIPKEPEVTHGGLPTGFTSFKSLSATAKASYKWSELVEKKRAERNAAAASGGQS